MSAPITPDERAAMRALADAAHPGPWRVVRNHVRARGVGTHPGEKEASIFDDPRVGERDAEFIAAARTAVPRLLDALDTAEAKMFGQRNRLRSMNEKMKRLRSEVTRLHALVADLRAAHPAPVWDEGTVTEAVASALREHGGWSADLPDDEMDCCARAVLAVVREHLPVKPDRETIARAMYENDLAHGRVGESWGDLLPETRTWYLDQADATLALWGRV